MPHVHRQNYTDATCVSTELHRCHVYIDGTILMSRVRRRNYTDVTYASPELHRCHVCLDRNILIPRMHRQIYTDTRYASTELYRCHECIDRTTQMPHVYRHNYTDATYASTELHRCHMCIDITILMPHMHQQNYTDATCTSTELCWCHMCIDRSTQILRVHWQKYTDAKHALTELHWCHACIDRTTQIPRVHQQNYTDATCVSTELHRCHVYIDRTTQMPRLHRLRMTTLIPPLDHVHDFCASLVRPLNLQGCHWRLKGHGMVALVIQMWYIGYSDIVMGAIVAIIFFERVQRSRPGSPRRLDAQMRQNGGRHITMVVERVQNDQPMVRFCYKLNSSWLCLPFASCLPPLGYQERALNDDCGDHHAFIRWPQQLLSHHSDSSVFFLPPQWGLGLVSLSE